MRLSSVICHYADSAPVILLVFWYCHKRGREVRLEKERELTDAEVRQLEKEYSEFKPGEDVTTTAPHGASTEDVEAGIKEVQEARRASEVAVDPDVSVPQPSTLSTTVQSAEQVGIPQ